MRNSELRSIFAILAAVLGASSSAAAQTATQSAQGFAVERLYLAPAGGGWFVMDALDMHGGFGGAVELTTGYAKDALVLNSGSQHLAVVSDDVFADVGLAATYDRFRLSLDLTSPLVMLGQSGTVGSWQYTSPNYDLGQNPDTLSDARIGFDARAYGQPGGVFRLGADAQLFIPSGNRANYDTDGTVRAMFRVLFAGDAPFFSWAAHIGAHVRPLDDASTPGSPQGSELLFGAAAGARLAVQPKWNLVVGPEVFGETAFRSFFGATTTGVEGLLGVRLEGSGEGPQLRVKIGAGAGLDPNFGAPEWRLVAAVEFFNPGGAFPK